MSLKQEQTSSAISAIGGGWQASEITLVTTARDHGEADVGVGARMVAVGDQSGTVESPTGTGTDPGREPVAEVADSAGDGEGSNMIDVADSAP